MQRDWDVIRKILLKVEALPTESSKLHSGDLVPEGIDAESAVYHMRMLIESGLIVGECNTGEFTVYCYSRRLTWEGHEILDKIKRDATWNKIKETAREKGLDLTIDVVKAAAKSLVSQLF